MSYNDSYQKAPNLWGDRPSKFLTMFEDKFAPGGACLDLGCGQGRDALYLAKKNFKVTAVDSSDVAINQLKQKIAEENVGGLDAVCFDIASFKITPDKFQLIIAINSLQFLPRERCLKLIADLKEKVAPQGFIVIKSFTTQDSTFIKFRNNIDKTFFQPNELKELFSDFNIIHHFEYLMFDPGHGDKPEPHLHGLVELVAQKPVK